MTQSADPWLNLKPASYQADGAAEPIYFTARTLGEKGGLRIAPRPRPWQPGEKLDETGHMADEFFVDCIFHNDVTEPGLELQQMWPTAIEALLVQFKTGKTGTLHLPWKRNLRVKPVSWERRANADEHRGGETLTVTFKADNEDILDREAFEKVSVKASAQISVEEASFDLESIGCWDGSIEDLSQLAADLVGLLNAPGEYANAILAAAKRLRRAAQTVMGALSTLTPGRNQLNDPDGASARGKMLDLLELASRAEAEARSALPKIRTVTFDRTRDIWTIATELRQSARELISINGHIEDVSFIEAGTPVQVFAE